jgi:hypothetical protein
MDEKFTFQTDLLAAAAAVWNRINPSVGKETLN